MKWIGTNLRHEKLPLCLLCQIQWSLLPNTMIGVVRSSICFHSYFFPYTLFLIMEILQVHRIDHQPRCFPFEMFGEANDSRPCTVMFSADTVCVYSLVSDSPKITQTLFNKGFYVDAANEFCCIMANVGLLQPNWTQGFAPGVYMSPSYVSLFCTL